MRDRPAAGQREPDEERPVPALPRPQGPHQRQIPDDAQRRREQLDLGERDRAQRQPGQRSQGGRPPGLGLDEHRQPGQQEARGKHLGRGVAREPAEVGVHGEQPGADNAGQVAERGATEPEGGQHTRQREERVQIRRGVGPAERPEPGHERGEEVEPVRLDQPAGVADVEPDGAAAGVAGGGQLVEHEVAQVGGDGGKLGVAEQHAAGVGDGRAGERVDARIQPAEAVLGRLEVERGGEREEADERQRGCPWAGREPGPRQGRRGLGPPAGADDEAGGAGGPQGEQHDQQRKRVDAELGQQQRERGREQHANQQRHHRQQGPGAGAQGRVPVPEGGRASNARRREQQYEPYQGERHGCLRASVDPDRAMTIAH